MKIVGIVAGIIVAPVLGMVLILGAMFGVQYTPTSASTNTLVGPPTNLSSVSPPANIVAIDEEVTAGYPLLISCQVSASLLLAQQKIESGYDPTAVSSAGADGLAQFEPQTFSAYDMPVPPGGASPPTPGNPTDAAWAEGRYLCSLGIDRNPTDALIAYNCGNISPQCIAASTGYAQTILALALKIYGGTPKPILKIGVTR